MCRLDLVGVHHRVYSVVEVLGSGEPNEEVVGSLTCTYNTGFWLRRESVFILISAVWSKVEHLYSSIQVLSLSSS